LKLLRIHIDNFGKINDLDLEFSDGINVIKEPNAWGKSTLAAFIKVMFYGFDAKKIPGAPEKERAFYTPWQGGVYGGELDFAVGSRKYRISRTFGTSEKKDVCHVYDLETMLESVDFAGNVGELLFDLDSNSFKRSVFIAQNDCASQTSDAINAKLGNLAENTNDINNYETAQERLKNQMNGLNPHRVTGSIKKRKAVIAELENELKGYSAAVSSLEELGTYCKEAEENKAKLIQERENLAGQLRLASEDSRRRELQKQYLDICTEAVQKLEVLETFSETFPIGAPDEVQFARVIKSAREIEEKRMHLAHLRFSEPEAEQYEKLASMFGNAIPTEVEIDTIINRFSKVADVKEDKFKLNAELQEKERYSMVVEPLPDKPKSTNMFTILGTVFVILGGLAFGLAITAYFTFNLPPFYMFGGVGLLLVATVMFVLANLNYKRAMSRYEEELSRFKQRQQDEIDEIEQLKNERLGKENQITDMEEEVRQFLEKYSVYCGVTGYSGALYELKSQAKEYLRLKERLKDQEQIEYECRDLTADIETFCNDWQLNIDPENTADLIGLQTEAAKYRSAVEAAQYAGNKKALFEKSNDMNDVETQMEAPAELDDINNEISQFDERIENVRATIDQYHRQIEEMREQLDRLDEIRLELDETLAVQAEEQHRYDVITKTQELLSIAREQFTSRYMAPISNAFRKYYNRIIETQGDDWVIDASISLKRREMGELRTVEHLSVGYQDLIGVCMRLALVDAMYQEEKPFLVLDDPFVNLDEEKTVRGMELLNFVAEEYQTIYFTCHNSRIPS